MKYLMFAGLLTVLMLFAVAETRPGLAFQIVDSKVTLDVDAEGRPTVVTKLYVTSDASVVFWVNMTDVEKPLFVKWEFYFPSGTIYQTFTLTTEAPSPSNVWRWYAVWARVQIAGSSPENSPGEWAVKFYVDNALKVTDQFEIVTRQTLVERLASLESRIASLNKNLTELQTRYKSLEQNLTTTESQLNLSKQTIQTLNANITALQGQVKSITNQLDNQKKEADALRSANTKLQSDFASLQIRYDTAVKDNDSLKGQLSTATGLQYVFIGTTAAFAVLTVLVWRRKGAQARMPLQPPVAEIPPVVEPSPPLQSRVCANCKNEIPAEVRFCPVCGTPQA